MKKIEKICKVEMCLTSKCNLACKHCYQHFDKDLFYLEKNKVLEVIDYVVSKGCSNIVLSGGEVFTRPDIYEIIGYILEKKLDLLVVTNGILINMNKIKKFKNKLSFQISIDGCEVEHNKRRGEGSYDKTVNNIKLLRKLGFKVTVNVTIDVDNYKNVIDLLEDGNFDEITFLPVATAGAATIYKKTHNNELEQVIRELYLVKSAVHKKNYRCNIFPTGLSINYDGTVYPCSIARDFKLFPIGSINENKIEVIIDKFLENPDSNMFFEYKENSQILKCINCSKENECNRGCRIRAYKTKNSLLEPDPFCCKLYKNSYKNVCFGDIYWGNL